MQRTFSLLALSSVFILTACGTDEQTPQPTPQERLEPPPAGQGLQYKMVTTINPGQEIERCQFFVAPAEGLHINSEKIRYTPGSHHVLIFSTAYTEVPTKTIRGVDLDTSGIFDCPDGAIADWQVNGVIAGSQSAEGEGIVGTLPEGVAITIAAGTVLMMNTHYLNASIEPLEADARINLYTIPTSEVREEAGVLFYYNPFIRVVAGGTSSAEMICPVWKDINVVSVQSHMHARGVGFNAQLVDANGSKREIYQNTAWENVPTKRFEPALNVPAGSALQYRCNYRNSGSENVIQGGKTSDEMCMLIGPYYPRDLNLENCLDEQGNFAATWVGGGTASCAAAMQCQFAAVDQGSFFGCVVDSCPAASVEVTDVTRCLFSDGFGACTEACNGGVGCNQCIANACGPQFSACMAADCNAVGN